MTDLIDRQAALAELDKAAWGKAWDKALAAEMLKSLPSAQQWIPCSERLPDKTGQYLITYTVLMHNEISINTYNAEEKTWFILGFRLPDVTAWMPLPEPWEGWE